MARLISLLCILSLLCMGQNELDPLYAKKKKIHVGGGRPLTWTFIQQGYNDSNGSNCTIGVGHSTCLVTMGQAIGAGHTLIITGRNLNALSQPSMTISSETATACSVCQGVQGSQFGGAGWNLTSYVLNTTGGGSSITCTQSQDMVDFGSCSITELAWGGTSVAFDTGTEQDALNCTSCTGNSLTLCGGSCVGTPDVVLTVPFGDGTGPTSTPGGWTALTGEGFYMLNTASGTAPTFPWTAPSDVVISAIALKGS